MTKGTHLIISTATELLRINIRHLLYIQADGNYSILCQVGGENRTVTMQLGQIEKLLEQQIDNSADTFVRIGRGLIVNTAFIYSINLPKQQLILSDSHQGRYTLSASRQSLTELKQYIEQNL